VSRTGVFICYCEMKAGGAIDRDGLVRAVREWPDVGHASICEDMCLDPGLAGLRRIVAAEKIDAAVVTTCTSATHASAIRAALALEGLEPHRIRIVDLETHLSWPPRANLEATRSGIIEAIRRAVEALRTATPGTRTATPITKRALVIGGGIAGIQTSLDIADAGYEVLLVEKTSSIGGHMLQYAEVFPTLDCPQCIGTPKMVEVGQHAKIRILACSEVESVSGSAGDFTVTIRRKATYVDWEKCNGCGICQQKCLTPVPSEYNRRLPFNQARAISTPFAQAVPNKPVINRDLCGHFTTELCQVCAKICPLGAIDFEQQDTLLEEKVGAIVVAAGFDLMPKSRIGEFAGDKDIVDGIEFERILCPSGPTAGVVRRPSDGREPREVVFVSCAGSRDPELGVPYCSRVCCMYLAKQALLYRHVVHDGQAYLFYMDQRTTGKGYEEFAKRAVEEYGVVYLRGRVSKIFRDGDQLRVQGVDTLSGAKVEIPCDLVVLGMAMIPSEEAMGLARKLGIATDEHGFIAEAHPKLRPMETTAAGIFVAGTAQGPRDIPDSVAMASGAASMVLELFSKNQIDPDLEAA
jgi:heterodisulfide reductase subunit A